jgi:hypothetical protein
LLSAHFSRIQIRLKIDEIIRTVKRLTSCRLNWSRQLQIFKCASLDRKLQAAVYGAQGIPFVGLFSTCISPMIGTKRALLAVEEL